VRDVYGCNYLVRVGRLVFAASLRQLATKIDQIMISSEEIAAKASINPLRSREGFWQMKQCGFLNDYRPPAGCRLDRSICRPNTSSEAL
jgi:hypothetical protein